MKALREAVESGKEAAVHEYLKAHTDLIVGHDAPVSGWVISQYPIGHSYVADFAYIKEYSGACPIYLIELARPSIAIFRKNDQFTSEFHQELQQVNDWLRAHRRTHETFITEFKYRFGQRFADYAYLAPERGRLYVGRRSELSTPVRQERWKGMCEQSHFVEIRTYDALIDQDDHLTNSGWSFNLLSQLGTMATRCSNPDLA